MIARCARGFVATASLFALAGCFRGTLPPREFYRLTMPDQAAAAPAVGTPPLTGSIGVSVYDTPGVYGTGALVYRVGPTGYGAYPSREWAIPLGEMLGAMTEEIVQQRRMTSGRVSFGAPATREAMYEWHGNVREFDEVDGPAAVSASVSLTAKLVRVADDSVIWSGTIRETEPVVQSRSIDAVVQALSAAAARAITRLTDEAAGDLRRLAAGGARER